MDAAQTMIDNLHKNTGKTLEEWIGIAKKQGYQKHGEIVKYLKAEHGFTHGFANLVAMKTLKTDAASAGSERELIDPQYKGKEHFLPLYQKLVEVVKQFGSDVELAPKRAYVSIRRKKQFAIFQPATKTRFEVQLNLKGEPATGMLEEITSANAMCSHKICLSPGEAYTEKIGEFLKTAYDRAG